MGRPLVNSKGCVFVCLGVLLLGFATLWLAGPLTEGRCLYAEDGLVSFPEGTAVEMTVSLWPPGSRCSYSLPDGRALARTKPIAFAQYLSLGGVVLVTLVLCRGYCGVRSRMRS